MLVDARLAPLRQHHNRHGGELLGYRPQIKRSVRRDWPPSFKIREAIALLVDDLIPVDDEERGTWTLRRVHVGEDIIDLAVKLTHLCRLRPETDVACTRLRSGVSGEARGAGPTCHATQLKLTVLIRRSVTLRT